MPKLNYQHYRKNYKVVKSHILKSYLQVNHNQRGFNLDYYMRIKIFVIFLKKLKIQSILSCPDCLFGPSLLTGVFSGNTF